MARYQTEATLERVLDEPVEGVRETQEGLPYLLKKQKKYCTNNFSLP